MTPLLSVVIVNWNGGPGLQDCLAAVFEPSARGGGLQVEAILVDNASTDGSTDAVHRHWPGLRVMRNASNRGFAVACNQGAAAATGELLVFLNPDLVVAPGALEGCAAFLRTPGHERYAACGPRLHDRNRRIWRSCARFPRPVDLAAAATGLVQLAPRWFRDVALTEWAHDADRDVDHVIGAFYVIRREVFEAAGGFDERFFVYLEDLDLSLRVHKAGHAIRFLASVTGGEHVGGGVSAQVAGRRLFYALRSRLLFARKHFGAWPTLLVTAATVLVEPLARLAGAALGRGGSSPKATVEAYALLASWLLRGRR